MVVSIMDEAPADASRTRQQKAVERTAGWVGDLALLPSLPQEGGREGGRAGGGGGRMPFLLGGIVGGPDLKMRSHSVRLTLEKASPPPSLPSSLPPSPLSGIVIGGLGLGETAADRLSIYSTVLPSLPPSLLRMVVAGQGGMEDVLAAVAAGVDVIACPLPLLLTREGHALVGRVRREGGKEGGAEEEPARKRARREGGGKEEEEEGEEEEEEGIINLWDRKWRKDGRPLREGCGCLACRTPHSRAYIHHLLLCHEMLGEVCLFVHNLEWVIEMGEEARKEVLAGSLEEYRVFIKGIFA